MSTSFVQLARSFIYSCTGYAAPEWRTTAEAIRDEITQAVEDARFRAEEAEALLDRRAIDLSGGVTVLRWAIAQASAHMAAADQAAKHAAARHKALQKHLADNKAALNTVGDTASLVQDAAEAAAEAKTAHAALRGAGAPSAAYHDLAARLNGGLAVRVEAAAGRTGGVAAVDAHAKLSTKLTSGGEGDWDEARVRQTVGKVTTGIAELERMLVSLESGSGSSGGTDALPGLRAAAMRKFYDITAGYGMAGVLEQAAETLRAQDPRIRPQHLAGSVGGQAAAPGKLETALAQAGDAASIDRALQAALQSFRDSVASFATGVGDGSLLPGLKTRADTAVGKQVDVANFNQAKATTEEALRELRRAGAENYPSFKKAFDDAVAHAYDTQAYGEAATTVLPDLEGRIDDAYEEHKKATAVELDKLEKEVAALRIKLAEAEKSKDAKQAAPILLTARANLDEADNFLDCNGNLEAAKPARALIAQVTELLKDFSSASSGFAALNTTLGKIKTALANADLKLLPAGELAALGETLTLLQSPTHGLTPAEFTTQVEQLKADLLTQTQFAAKLKQWRADAALARTGLLQTYTEYADAVAKAPAGGFTGNKPDPATGEIKAGIDGLAVLQSAEIAADAFDAHTLAWSAAVKAVTDRLAAVWDANAKALKDHAAVSSDSERGMKRQEDAATVAGEWRTLYNKAVGYGREIAAAKGNMGQHAVLMKQLGALQSAIETDPDGARAQLEDIETKLASIRGTPAFDQAIARAIGQVPAQWKGVLDQTGANIDRLRDAAATAATGGTMAASIDAFGKLLDGVKQRFAPAAFTAIAQSLAEADPTGAKRDARRAAREDGLRLVRQYQASLDDPMLMHLQANPFGVPLFGPLFRFLDRVELELTRIAC